MHQNRSLDYGDWQPLMSEPINSFVNNTYIPFENSENLEKWKESKHVGTGIPERSTNIEKQLDV